MKQTISQAGDSTDFIPKPVIKHILEHRRQRLAAEAKAKRDAIIRVVDILAELGALVQAEKESSSDTEEKQDL